MTQISCTEIEFNYLCLKEITQNLSEITYLASQKKM